MWDNHPPVSAALITAPTEDVRQFDLNVRVPGLHKRSVAWIRLVANCQTQEVRLASGVKRIEEDNDGA